MMMLNFITTAIRAAQQEISPMSSTTRNFTDTVTLNALSNSSNGLDGGIQEVVFWSADQSSNRTAIETNIMTYYSIP
jgi:hypothetical protein